MSCSHRPDEPNPCAACNAQRAGGKVDPYPPLCQRPNPGYPPRRGTFRTHLCRCSHTPGHPGKHWCDICNAKWNPPDMDPEHPAVRKPWPPTIGGDQ